MATLNKAYFKRMGKLGAKRSKKVVTTKDRARWGREGARRRWKKKQEAA